MQLKIIYGDNAAGKTTYFERMVGEGMVGYKSKDVISDKRLVMFSKMEYQTEFKTKDMEWLENEYGLFLEMLITFVEKSAQINGKKIWELIEKFGKTNIEENVFDYKSFFRFDFDESIGGKVFNIERILFFDELLNYDYDVLISREDKQKIIKYVVINKINEKLLKWRKKFEDILGLKENFLIENIILDKSLMETPFYEMCEKTSLSAFEKKNFHGILETDFSSSSYSWDLKNALLYQVQLSLEDDEWFKHEAKNIYVKYNELSKKSNDIIGFNKEKIAGATKKYINNFVAAINNSSLADDFSTKINDDKIILIPFKEKRSFSTGQMVLVFILEKISEAISLQKDVIFDDILETLDDENKAFVIDEIKNSDGNGCVTILSHDSFVNGIYDEDEKVQIEYISKKTHVASKGAKMHHVHAANIFSKSEQSKNYDGTAKSANKIKLNNAKELGRVLLRISYRTFGRDVGNFSKYFSSSKKHVNPNSHGLTLYNSISNEVMHYKKHGPKSNIYKIFAEDKKWVKSKVFADSLEFCELIILEIESVINDGVTNFAGVSFYALKDSWINLSKRLVGEKNNKNKMKNKSVSHEIHYLDLHRLDD